MEKNTLQNSLNELSKGTTNDVDSIMIRDAAGNQYWIAKADLASVLGELSINQKIYPYMYKGISEDLNTIFDSGFYEVSGSSIPNVPEGFFPYGILEVEKSNNYYVQKYYPVLKGTSSTKYGLAIRMYVNKKWEAWNYIPYNN